jgi:hypothetical protein
VDRPLNRRQAGSLSYIAPGSFGVIPRHFVPGYDRGLSLRDALANRLKFCCIPPKPVGIALNYWLFEMNLDNGDGARTTDQWGTIRAYTSPRGLRR